MTKNLPLGLNLPFAIMICSLLAYLGFNSLSPEFMHADVVMNSIMSLENITLFYWGQNRLLNILPLLAAPFRDPETNLFVVSWLTCFCSFMAIFRITQLLAKLLPAPVHAQSILVAATLVSVTSMSLFKAEFLFSFLVAHIEYPLAILLASAAGESLCAHHAISRRRFAFDMFTLLLAVFVNPSVALVIFFIALALYLLKSASVKLLKPYALGTFLCLAAWQIISTQMSNQSYTSFRFGAFFTGLAEVLSKIAATLPSNLGGVMLVTFALSVAILYHQRMVTDRMEWYTLSVLSFCLGWVVFFSCHKHVIISGYKVQYFAFVIYGLMSLAALVLLTLISKIPNRLGLGIALVCLAIVTSRHYAPLAPFSRYALAKDITPIPAPSPFVSGNYWLAWPIVFQKMTRGIEAMGLTYRGKGNRSKALQAVEKAVSQDGFFTVNCVDATVEFCHEHIERSIGRKISSTVAGVSNTSRKVTDLRIEFANADAEH